MRIDRVVPCFSPYGVLQTKYGIVLSTDGKAETEVVAKFDEIVNPVFEAIPFLVSKYEKKLSKFGIELPAEETLNELRQRIMFIHEELGGH